MFMNSMRSGLNRKNIVSEQGIFQKSPNNTKKHFRVNRKNRGIRDNFIVLLLRVPGIDSLNPETVSP